MDNKWICVELDTGREFAEELAAEAAEAFGVSVEQMEEGIRFYIKDDLPAEDLDGAIGRFLEDFKKFRGSDASFPYRYYSSEVDDWVERWKVNFKPLRVGRHFIVTPTWEKIEPEVGDRVIWMDPGRAFGTGHHETTRLCLEWLERWPEIADADASRSLLDVGTGSGILAMAAALLGCRRVLGVDNDPEAIEVAVENLELNGLSARVQLMTGTVSDVDEKFDVVIANIQALPLIAMADDLIGHLKRPGRLVLSGILVEQKESILAAFEAKGLRAASTITAGEWCLIEFV
ncbi:MAG: 50S ribosomal protein L11 methyltransferase [Syntrophobacteraceae bacterium]|nr:50S ribosomal protein L11 methyltransferase [Desulfobacteraceae bacterium]